MDAALSSGPRAEQGPIDPGLYWDGNRDFLATVSGRTIATSEHEILMDLLSMNHWGAKSSKDPYTWGFTLYRTCFGPQFNQRFATAVKKLDSHVRYLALQKRHSRLRRWDKEGLVDELSTDGKILPSRDLARRFKFDVVEELAGGENKVAAGLGVDDGNEDFMAVGAAFCDWVEENALDTSGLHVRNDHCVIIDEKSLVTLEALPDENPEPGPTKLVAGCDFTKSPQLDAWVWMLDRGYYQRYVAAGESPSSPRSGLPPHDHPNERRFEPWVRTRISNLMGVWWGRPHGYSPSSWQACIARDREKFDKVNWWQGATATTTNDSARRQFHPEGHAGGGMLGTLLNRTQ